MFWTHNQNQKAESGILAWKESVGFSSNFGSNPNVRGQTFGERLRNWDSRKNQEKMQTELFAELLPLYIAITCRLLRVTPALQLHHIYATIWYRMKEFSKRSSPEKTTRKNGYFPKADKGREETILIAWQKQQEWIWISSVLVAQKVRKQKQLCEKLAFIKKNYIKNMDQTSKRRTEMLGHPAKHLYDINNNYYVTVVASQWIYGGALSPVKIWKKFMTLMFQNSDKKDRKFVRIGSKFGKVTLILTVPPSGETYWKIEFERVMLSLGPGWPKFPFHRESPKKK